MRIVRLLAPQNDERLQQMNTARLPAQNLTLEQISDRLRGGSLTAEDDKPAVLAAVAALVRARILFVGTRIKCSVCTLDPWRIVDELASQITCSGCRSPILFDGMAPDSTAEARWSYQLNAAFNGIIDQGAAAVVLALARLRDDAPDSFRFCTGRTIHGLSREIEVDGIVCVGSNVGVLEAKSSGQIDENTILRTLDVADAIDATAYFATLDSWQSPGAELLQQAAAEHKSLLGVPRVRVLTGTDLVSRGVRR